MLRVGKFKSEKITQKKLQMRERKKEKYSTLKSYWQRSFHCASLLYLALLFEILLLKLTFLEEVVVIGDEEK